MPTTKELARAAARLHAACVAKADQARLAEALALGRLADAQRALARARARSDKARARGLTLATLSLRPDLLSRLRAVELAACTARDAMERQPPAAPPPAHWVAELRQVEDEFGNLDIDWRRQAAAAVTGPITLEGMALGPFEVRLAWARLTPHADVRCFDVVALEPRPAGGDDTVPHPHVKRCGLCPGDADAPIRLALEQGRLADAFCLVRAVLGHYNPGSAYVRLEDWGDARCPDCDGATAGDDLRHCGGCGLDYCPECARDCGACDEPYCYGCLEPCAACGRQTCPDCRTPLGRPARPYCARCVRPCAGCGARTARQELSADPGLCPACRDRQPQQTDGPTPTLPEPTPDPSTPEEAHAPTADPAPPAAA